MAWAGAAERTDIKDAGFRAVAARDLMTYDVPAHELTANEATDCRRANREAVLAEMEWRGGSSSVDGKVADGHKSDEVAKTSHRQSGGRGRGTARARKGSRGRSQSSGR